MKKIFSIAIFLSLFYCITGNALDTKLIDLNFNSNGFLDCAVFKDKIYMLSVAKNLAGYFIEPDVIILEKGEWKRIPNYIGNDTNNKLNIINNSVLHFDSTGNIWLCGQQLYKFDGNQWAGYSIGDTNENKRRFLQFCIDKYSNIWATAMVRLSSIEYGEFYKFSGLKFNQLLTDTPFLRFMGYCEFMKSSTIAATPEGRIVLHGVFTIMDEDYENGQYNDIYLFSQDETYQRLKLQTASGSKYNGFIKTVSYVRSEENRIFFTLGINNGELEQSQNKRPCCSGISIYEEGKWTLFNEENGLDTLIKDVYEPVYRIAKLSDGRYFLVGQNMYYIMDSNLKLKKYTWEGLFNKAEFIVCHTYYYGEKGKEYLNNFLSYPPIPGTMVKINTVSIENNKIYIGMEKGLLIADESVISSVVEKIEDNADLIVYPNPSDGNIKIKTEIEYSSYQVINSIGKVEYSGQYSDGIIPLTNLQPGIYIIKLYGTNRPYTVKCIISK